MDGEGGDGNEGKVDSVKPTVEDDDFDITPFQKLQHSIVMKQMYFVLIGRLTRYFRKRHRNLRSNLSLLNR